MPHSKVRNLVVTEQHQLPKEIEMGCADEDFAMQKFTLVELDTANGKPEYGCNNCGWMQSSPRAGGHELLNLATWASESEKSDFAARVAQQPDTASMLTNF